MVKIVISPVTAESGLRNSIYFENGLRGERSVVKRNGITGLIQLKRRLLSGAIRKFLVHNRIVNGSFCGVTGA
jgi:hypothetical protein